jgi:hypothetical protein
VPLTRRNGQPTFVQSAVPSAAPLRCSREWRRKRAHRPGPMGPEAPPRDRRAGSYRHRPMRLRLANIEGVPCSGDADVEQLVWLERAKRGLRIRDVVTQHSASGVPLRNIREGDGTFVDGFALGQQSVFSMNCAHHKIRDLFYFAAQPKPRLALISVWTSTTLTTPSAFRSWLAGVTPNASLIPCRPAILGSRLI